MAKIVAIHQPNFLPWLGYFDKMVRADVFVFLDNVPLQKTGGSYMNRVEMIISGRRSWVTVPVSRDTDVRRRIGDVRIVENSRWRRKLRMAIEQSYAAAPFFDQTMPLVAELLDNDEGGLSAFNIGGISRLAATLAIEARPRVNASSLPVSGSGTDLLVSIVQAVGGTTYLCGGGAAGYQEDEKILAAGLMLEYQNFQHPHYQQVTSREFSAGLSVIDALMNCGAAAVRAMLAPRDRMAHSV